MKFYDILQLDPQITKKLIHTNTDMRVKLKFASGMFIRSLLIVLFAIVFISGLSAVFGSENSPMAVSIFCILLGIRFVDFGFCIRDELKALFIVFLVLLVSPVAACSVFPAAGFIIHVISFFLILFVTCDKPEMGNGGLYSFAYIYLSGNPVYGESFTQRFYLTIAGFVICGLILYFRHRNKNKDITFQAKIKSVRITDYKYQWMIRMTIGVSAVLALGAALDLERFMWIGFACGSLLSEYSPNPDIRKRFVQRFTGVVAGGFTFFIIYKLLPCGLHGIIGPAGGFCLGFCTDYRIKTAVNCMGALMIASEIYGLHASVLLRIINTVIGIVFAIVFYYVYNRCIMQKIME